MAVKVIGGAVNVMTGRGRSATVALSISFRELERWAKRNAIDTKRLMARSMGRAVSGLKRQFEAVMTHSGGVAGVPKFAGFEDFTRSLRAVKGISNRRMGGVLAEKKRIVAYKKNGWQVIGWPDALASWAVKFQDAVGPTGTDPFADARQRAAWHRMGIAEIPRAYVRKPRRVIPEPFGSHVKANLKKWAKEIYYKNLAKQMQKSSGGAK